MRDRMSAAEWRSAGARHTALQESSRELVSLEGIAKTGRHNQNKKCETHTASTKHICLFSTVSRHWTLVFLDACLSSSDWAFQAFRGYPYGHSQSRLRRT